MALPGQEHVFMVYFLTNKQVTCQHKDLKRRLKDRTIQHDFLTNEGRNMPPYLNLVYSTNMNNF